MPNVFLTGLLILLAVAGVILRGSRVRARRRLRAALDAFAQLQLQHEVQPVTRNR
jgi:hypothetical protein